MSEETRFYQKIKSHSDNDNDLLPEAGIGTDTISVIVPNKFTRFTIELLSSPVVSGYEVISFPKKGSTGEQKFKIKYHYFPFSKVSYRLRAYSGKPQAVEIVVDSLNWLNEVKDAVEQDLEIRLVVRGIQARDLYRQILLLAPNDLNVPSDLFFERDTAVDNGNEMLASDSENGDQPGNPVSEPATVTITIAICASLVILSGFATLAGILMMAMQHGYFVDIGKFEVDTPVGKYSLDFKLRPPQA